MAEKYTKEILEKLVKESLSIAEVVKKLGMRPDGGCHSHIKNKILKYEIDTSHFLGRFRNLGKKFPNLRRPIEDYLSNNIKIKTHNLKLRLFEESLKEKKCEKCNLKEWLGREIPLELHHIDGNNQNHFFINLQILCPNCHALTDNYCNRNQFYKNGDMA